MTEDARLMVDGIEVANPQWLTFDEMTRLAHYNGERSRGISHDDAAVAGMRQLQLRFDWLGYMTSDGVAHPGDRAAPPILIRPVPRRGWRLWSRA